MRITAQVESVEDPISNGARHFKEVVLKEASGGLINAQVSENVFRAMEKVGLTEIGASLSATLKGHMKQSKSGLKYNNIHLIQFEK